MRPTASTKIGEISSDKRNGGSSVCPRIILISFLEFKNFVLVIAGKCNVGKRYRPFPCAWAFGPNGHVVFGAIQNNNKGASSFWPCLSTQGFFSSAFVIQIHVCVGACLFYRWKYEHDVLKQPSMHVIVLQETVTDHCQQALRSSDKGESHYWSGSGVSKGL